MSEKDKKTIEEEDIIEQMEKEVDRIEDEEWKINEEKIEEENTENTWNKAKEMLAKVTADFENFKKRTERDKEDMIFFLKSDILKKILPRLDDMERILKNTPEDMRENPLYEWIVSMQKKLISDLKSMWVESFESIWEEVNPDLHDVMSAVPGKEAGIIFDEFEKGYMLNWKVLRHAKVIVGA